MQRQHPCGAKQSPWKLQRMFSLLHFFFILQKEMKWGAGQSSEWVKATNNEQITVEEQKVTGNLNYNPAIRSSSVLIAVFVFIHGFGSLNLVRLRPASGVTIKKPRWSRGFFIQEINQGLTGPLS